MASHSVPSAASATPETGPPTLTASAVGAASAVSGARLNLVTPPAFRSTA
jgi:hypothetical protein